MEARDDLDEGQGRQVDPAFDLRHYWNVVKKRRWVILAVVIVATAGSMVFASRQPRIYKATATVIVEPQAPKILGGEIGEILELGAGQWWSSLEYFNTQLKIITSRALARAVVNKYKLHRDPRVVGDPPPGASEESLIEQATSAVQGRVQVAIQKESRVFAISVRDSDPKLARDLANYVADVYIEQNLAVKHDVTRIARGWVAKQLDTARAELHAAENALHKFKKENNILSVSLQDRQNMISQALETFTGALTETQRKRLELEARRKALGALIAETTAETAPSTYFSPTPAVEELRVKFLEERRQLQVLDERYGPKHPQVIAQRERMDAAFRDLKAEVESHIRSIDGEIKALKDSEAKFRAEVDKLTQDALDLNQREIEYKRLVRNAQTAEEIYALLLKRMNESGLEQQDYANNIRLLDEALLPARPVEPDVKKSGVLGLAVGLMLGFGLAFAIEFLDRSVKTQEDIESLVGIPFLGMIPSVEASSGAGAPDLHVASHPNSTVAECCRVVRTNILFCSPDRPIRTLLVTSSNPIEGKTINVVNLGVVMAQSGHRTLLVDTDMRRPRLHKALGVSNENGVSRVVVGESTIDAAVKTTDVPNLFVLPCGPIPPNPAELLQTEKFAALARALADRYDRVIFDSPPVLAVTDAAVLSRVVDGVVLVMRAGRTTRDAALRARRAIQKVKASIVGGILNDVNLKNPHYASYYHYYQYKYHEAPAPASAPATAAGGPNPKA